MAGSKFPVLDKYGVNLTELAHQGKLEVSDDGIDEIDLSRMVQIVGRRSKSHLIIVSDYPYLIEQYIANLSMRLIAEDVQDSLRNTQLYKVIVQFQNSSDAINIIEELSQVTYRQEIPKHDAIIYIENLIELMELGDDVVRKLQESIGHYKFDSILSMTRSEHRQHIDPRLSFLRKTSGIDVDKPLPYNTLG
jgi:ATP-dependent Clp protease ATP-binding subunit ClpA